MNPYDIKFSEVDLFLTALRFKSIREVGRQKNMRPGQVSKCLSSLERKVGGHLFMRSTSGVTLTAKGLELVPVFEKMYSLMEKLSSGVTQSENERRVLASTSFLSTHLVPQVIQELTLPILRLIDLAPVNVVPAGLRGGFDFCIHSEKLDWPKTWVTREVGYLRWNLYARPHHPVLKTPTTSHILQYPFIIPVYWTQEGMQYGNDYCPLPVSKRIKGYETSTALSAAHLVRASDQLAFLPELVAGPLELVRVAAPWKEVRTPVYLTVKGSVVRLQEFDKLSGALAKFTHGSSTKAASRSKS